MDINDTDEFKFLVELDNSSMISSITSSMNEIDIILDKNKFENINVYKSKCLSFIRETVIPGLCKCDKIHLEVKFFGIELNSYLENQGRLNPFKFKIGDISYVYGEGRIIKIRSDSKLEKIDLPLFKEQKESKNCIFIKDVLKRLIYENFNTTKGQEVKKSVVLLEFKNIGKNCGLELYYDAGNQPDIISFSTNFYDQEDISIHIEDDNIVVPGRINEKIIDAMYKSMCYVGGIMYIKITLDEDIDEEGENKNIKIKFTDDLTLKSYKDEESEDNILNFKFPLEKVDENKVIKWTEKRDKLDAKIITDADEKDFDIRMKNNEIVGKILGK